MSLALLCAVVIENYIEQGLVDLTQVCSTWEAEHAEASAGLLLN